ncbi:MAG: hypothetical protein H6719_10350 [Sandaracinaceae bacterium]|nr:hypothetical protein [Sandaracinaceae bacterium]
MTFLSVLLLAILAFGLIAGIGWYFSDDQRAKRAMRGAPRRVIADVLEGERARVVGEVHVEAPVASPLSGRLCAYWRVIVEEKISRGKSSYWRTIVDEAGGVDFFLRDDSGKALVRTSHVQAVLDGDARGGSGFLNDPTPELTAFLAARGHDTQGWIFNKTIRYREGIAEPGETVAVVGRGRWERDPDEAARAGEGYREAVSPKRLVVEAPESGPLLVSDQADVTQAD